MKSVVPRRFGFYHRFTGDQGHFKCAASKEACNAPVYTPIMGGVTMEKRKPHYLLRDIKVAFADPAKLNRSFASKQGADDLGMDDQSVVDAIQALTAADFDKSMTSYANPRVWQDVYRPRIDKTELYVKFTLDSMNALYIISFKEA